MKPRVNKAVHAIDIVSIRCGQTASWTSLILIVTILYEVVARYVFGAPTQWSMELGTYLFAVIWVFSGAYTHQSDGHVKVDLFYTRLSQRGKSIIDTLTAPFVLVFCVVMTYQLLDAGLESVKMMEHSSSQWSPPIYMVKMLLPVGSILLSLQCIAKIIRDGTMTLTGKEAIQKWLPIITSICILAVTSLYLIMGPSKIVVNTGLVAITLFGSFALLMVTGLPIIFCMGFVSIIFLYLLMGPNLLGILASRAWDAVDMPIVVCLPMFVFMGVMLERSGVAKNLYDMMYKFAGGLRGGLAAGTVFICMIMAAMTGLSAPTTLTMGLTALPEMLKRGYNKSIALGCIGAGGALGILIPPSVTMVIYALVAQQSVGKLFMGGIFPGIILGCLFIVYIFIRSWLQPSVAPALPIEERASWVEKGKSLVNVLLPILIVFMVLGTIFLGVATPTEASAVGALGTIIAAAVNRQLNIKSLKETCFATARICGMAIWLLALALAIKTITFSVGAGPYIEKLFLQLPGGIWGPIIAMQIIWFVLGCLIDPTTILFITGPIFCSIIQHAGLSLVWFGVVFIVNMEMAYLTPPFGMNLFYLKGVAPATVTMGDIYRSIGPFVALQGVALALTIIFPQLVLWLPSQMIGSG